MKLPLFNQNEEFYMYSIVHYRLTILKKNITISIDEVISDLIAVNLGFTSITKDAHTAVRNQLEKLITPFYDPGSPCYPCYINTEPTQFIKNEAVLWLTGEELKRKYYEYRI